MNKHKDAVLLLDIGNSSIDVAIATKSRLRFLPKIPSSSQALKELKRGFSNKINKVVFSSVVPKLSFSLRRVFSQGFIWEMGQEAKVPIKNLYRYPQQVGQDRLLNCFAAQSLYPQAKVVVDLGTAITFDFISAEGGYLGGLIIPGINLSYAALLKKAALLPSQLKFKTPKNFIPQTTSCGISAGLYFGYNLMIKGVLSYCRRYFKKDLLAVGCGGDIKYISRKISSLNYLEPHLSLKGLYLIAAKHLKII